MPGFDPQALERLDEAARLARLGASKARPSRFDQGSDAAGERHGLGERRGAVVEIASFRPRRGGFDI